MERSQQPPEGRARPAARSANAQQHPPSLPPPPPLPQASGNLHVFADKNATTTVTFDQLKSSAQDLFVSNNIWRAPIAACALGGLMVALFNLMSCVILVR
jgi:hypothetical protein